MEQDKTFSKEALNNMKPDEMIVSFLCKTEEDIGTKIINRLVVHKYIVNETQFEKLLKGFTENGYVLSGPTVINNEIQFLIKGKRDINIT